MCSKLNELVQTAEVQLVDVSYSPSVRREFKRAVKSTDQGLAGTQSPIVTYLNHLTQYNLCSLKKNSLLSLHSIF